MLVAIILLIAISMSETARKNLFAAFQNGAWKALVVFITIAFISIPFSVWPGHAFGQFVDFFKLFLFCIMIVSCIRTEDELNKYILVFIVCMLYVAYGPLQNYLEGILVADLSGSSTVYRLESPILFYRNPNVLAITLLQCLPFIYYRLAYKGIFKEKLKSSLWLACIAFMLFIVIATGSRGGFIVLAGLGFFISYRSKYRKLAIMTGIVLAVLVWSMMSEDFQQRYSTISELGASDKSASDRILGLKHGFRMLLENPLLGVGVGSYPVARWRMFESSLWAHNLPGQLMGELGILGTVTFVIFIFKCFKNTRESREILVAHGLQKSLVYYQILALEASLFGQIINGIGQHSLYLFGFYVSGALSVVLLRIAGNKAEEMQAGEMSGDTVAVPGAKNLRPVNS